MKELDALDSTVEMIIIDNNACNDRSFTLLDLTRFMSLKVFEVGDYSFSYVNEVLIVGLPKLERVVIGKGCFKRNVVYDPIRHFYLKDCKSMRELKMGRLSFRDYSLIVIEDMDSLKTIEMGDLNEWSWTFSYASLELKSGL